MALTAKEKKIRESIETYRDLNVQAKELKLKMDSIKEEVGKFLHEVQVNDYSIELSDGEKWRAVYQETSRNDVDLKLLLETVGARRYEEIVTDKKSVSLYIKKAPKEKKSTVTNVKPVGDTSSMPNVPKGAVLA